MEAFCWLLGLANMAIVVGSALWWGADRSGSGAPAIVGVLAFNMALAWLFVAGFRKNAVGERIWSARPTWGAIALFALLVVGAFFEFAGRRT